MGLKMKNCDNEAPALTACRGGVLSNRGGTDGGNVQKLSVLRMLCRHNHGQDAPDIPVHRGAYYDTYGLGILRRFRKLKPGRGSARCIHLGRGRALAGTTGQGHSPGLQGRVSGTRASGAGGCFCGSCGGVRTLIIASFFGWF